MTVAIVLFWIATAPTLQVGQVGRLHFGSNTFVDMAPTAGDFGEFTKCMDGASSIKCAARLLDVGRVFQVPSGTRVQILGYRDNPLNPSLLKGRLVQARILDGPFRGRSMWTLEDRVARAVAGGTAPIRVTADQLRSAYSQDRKAADAKYAGKRLIVTGSVAYSERHRVDLATEGAVVVRCTSYPERPFPPLREGQRVSLEGQCDGARAGVFLSDCSLVGKER